MFELKPLFLLAVVATLSACTGQVRKQASVPLKIASWNVEHLAEADGAGCKARSEEDYAQLRKYVARLDADIVAFAEVESAAAAARIFPADQYTIEFSKRPSRERNAFCRRGANEGPTIRSQHVGFAIRKSVPFTRNPDLDELGLGDPDLRWGVDISVDNGKPMRLLALHLKSGCSKGDSAEACSVLFNQAPVLKQWVKNRTKESVDFVMLGDWNRRMSLPDDQLWKTLNADLPADARLVESSNGRKATCQERFPDYIDYIVLSEGAAKRMRADSFSEFSYGVAEDQMPSDHCPISIILN
jgi:endonuclease/exonuclease/phosphatase family metal-dependent hydrolase